MKNQFKLFNSLRGLPFYFKPYGEVRSRMPLTMAAVFFLWSPEKGYAE